MSTQDEIKAFFVNYINAFARNDADALSELWDTIGLFPSPTGNSRWSGRISASIW